MEVVGKVGPFFGQNRQNHAGRHCSVKVDVKLPFVDRSPRLVDTSPQLSSLFMLALE
ncbi:hypothethical protein [Ralstonia solanacearum PSI07]|nr:hypothethical protein [Ralstonia solanacearum PSI07]